MIKQFLTVEEVKAAARRYYDMGRLTAQHPDVILRACIYQMHDMDLDYRCSIGAGLTDDTLEYLHSNGFNRNASLQKLFNAGIVGAKETDAGLHTLANIQYAHDAWCQVLLKEERDTKEYQFLMAIDHPKAKKVALPC